MIISQCKTVKILKVLKVLKKLNPDHPRHIFLHAKANSNRAIMNWLYKNYSDGVKNVEATWDSDEKVRDEKPPEPKSFDSTGSGVSIGANTVTV